MDMMTKTMSALIDELGAEHAELLPCTARLLELAATNSPELNATIEHCASKLGAALDNHVAQEENVLFPAFAREAGDQGLVGQFSGEHREILRLRDELLAAYRSGADARKLGGVATQLADLLGSHMSREDMILFPSARNMFG